MPQAWITGAAGFIGQHLARSLCAQGWVVCGIGHGRPRAALAGWKSTDISSEALGQLAAECGTPQFVFHLAGGSTVSASLQAPLEDFRRTVYSSAVLLEWLRQHAHDARVIVASSAAVYGDTQGVAAQESRPPAPVSPYGHHKLMMEQLCREYGQVFGLRTAILRLFSVYGEGLRKQLLWDCSVKLAAPGERLQLGGSGAELRDWVHVDDAVAMLERIVELASPECPVLNGGSGTGVRVEELVSLLARALQCSKRIEFSHVRRPGDPAALVADVRRLQELGHRCRVALEEGVQRYATWFRQSRDG